MLVVLLWSLWTDLGERRVVIAAIPPVRSDGLADAIEVFVDNAVPVIQRSLRLPSSVLYRVVMREETPSPTAEPPSTRIEVVVSYLGSPARRVTVTWLRDNPSVSTSPIHEGQMEAPRGLGGTISTARQLLDTEKCHVDQLRWESTKPLRQIVRSRSPPPPVTVAVSGAVEKEKEEGEVEDATNRRATAYVRVTMEASGVARRDVAEDIAAGVEDDDDDAQRVGESLVRGSYTISAHSLVGGIVPRRVVPLVLWLAAVLVLLVFVVSPWLFRRVADDLRRYADPSTDAGDAQQLKAA